MTNLYRQPAAWAMGLALATLAAAVSAEEAKPASAAPAEHACHAGKVDAMTGGHGMARHVEPAAPMPGGGNGKGEPQTGPSGAPPSPGGAPPPAAGAAADSPHAHITLSGSNMMMDCPMASGTLPAAPAAQATRATKTRSNIQNN